MNLVKIYGWFKVNKLSLNLKKLTLSYLLEKKNIDNMSAIKIDNIIIERVANTKFLRVVITESLTCSDHIKTVQ